MIVIADTTPLNYLVLIDQVQILPQLYGRVLIPLAVWEEFQRPESDCDRHAGGFSGSRRTRTDRFFGCDCPATTDQFLRVTRSPESFAPTLRQEMRGRLTGQRVDTATALVTVGFSFDDEPTVNSQDELTVATSGSHNLRRRLVPT